MLDLVAKSYARGQDVLQQRPLFKRKQHGQFFTPPAVARYMALQLGTLPDRCRVLDPAVGSGVLLCALIERLISERRHTYIFITAFEIDPELCEVARSILAFACIEAAKYGLTLNIKVVCADYLSNGEVSRQPMLFPTSIEESPSLPYDVIIANPPYFKLRSDDKRVLASRAAVGVHTNIFTLFVALAVQSLVAQGRSVFIIPRSFCSGVYFAQFRGEFARHAVIERLHQFESRSDNFDDVLQENMIVTFRKATVSHLSAEPVTISTSHSGADLGLAKSHIVPASLVMYRRNGMLFYRLPINADDVVVLRTFDMWSGSLRQYGMDVSTGRLVAFRAKEHLQHVPDEDSRPLLWMQHVKGGRVDHPLIGLSKPQWIIKGVGSMPLLLPSANYVLLRRFSAKEEPRRLVAGAFLRKNFHYHAVGLENHLNYIYRRQGELSESETCGLAALYNSALFDRYFRIVNGNTQVNAAELRALPLPPLNIIQRIGAVVIADAEVDVNRLVLTVLQDVGLIPLELFDLGTRW